MKKRTLEFLIDTVSRASQIIFAVLIVGPFVSGFDIFIFGVGSVIFIILLIIGISFTKKPEVEEK